MRTNVISILVGIAIGFLGGLIASGIIYLTSSQPAGDPIKLNPIPTTAPILVHITGAVNNSGVYPITRHSRINDVIDAAGGLLPSADRGSLNLASMLQDGERIVVPEVIIASPTSKHSTVNVVVASTSIPQLVNINTASQIELENLPGIGTKRAAQIIAFREENGPFTSSDQIQKVSGIGVKIFENIQHLITVVDYIQGSP